MEGRETRVGEPLAKAIITQPLRPQPSANPPAQMSSTWERQHLWIWDEGHLNITQEQKDRKKWKWRTETIVGLLKSFLEHCQGSWAGIGGVGAWWLCQLNYLPSLGAALPKHGRSVRMVDRSASQPVQGRQRWENEEQEGRMFRQVSLRAMNAPRDKVHTPDNIQGEPSFSEHPQQQQGQERKRWWGTKKRNWHLWVWKQKLQSRKWERERGENKTGINE